MDLLDLTNVNTWLIYGALGALAYLSWQQPRYGVYLITAMLPAYLIRPRIGGLPAAILELAILVLFAVWLLKDKKWKRINVRPWKQTVRVHNEILKQFRTPLALLLLAGFFAMVASPHPLAAFGIFKAYLIEPVLFLIVFSYEIKTMRQRYAIVYCLGCTTMVLGLLAIWQYLTGLGIPNEFWANATTRRVTTIFGYPNANSLFVGPIITLYIGLLVQKKNRIALLYSIPVIALGLFTIVATKSTGALVAVGAAVLLLLFRYRLTRTISVALAIIAVATMLHMAILNGSIPGLSHRVTSNYLDLSSGSLEIRINQWRETLRLLKDHPFMGAGLAGYQTALQPYHTYKFLEIYLYPHNIFLNFWVELGILGLIALLWLTVALVRTIAIALRYSESQEVKNWAYALLLTWVVMYIHGLVDVPYFKNDLSVLFMIMVGLTMKLEVQK